MNNLSDAELSKYEAEITTVEEDLQQQIRTLHEQLEDVKAGKAAVRRELERRTRGVSDNTDAAHDSHYEELLNLLVV